MNEHAEQDELGRELWRRYLLTAGRRSDAAVAEEKTPLDPNVLAAYLDGTAAAGEVEQVEAWMASDPACLEEVLELRELQNLGQAAAPELLLARAKALAPPGVGPPLRLPAFGDVLRRWGRHLRWAAAAAAVVVACLGGYDFGKDTFQDQLRAQTSALAPLLELEELISEPELQMPEQVNGGNGGAS